MTIYRFSTPIGTSVDWNKKIKKWTIEKCDREKISIPFDWFQKYINNLETKKKKQKNLITLDTFIG